MKTEADKSRKSRLSRSRSPRNPLARFSTLILSVFVLIIASLLAADIFYLATHGVGFRDFLELLGRPEIMSALRLSIVTSLTTLLLVLAFAVPVGYALSRAELPAGNLFNTIADIPLVLPPVVIGVSLLAVFGTAPGQAFREFLRQFNIELVSGVGIVMGQFLVSISYCIRAAKASFDEVDGNLEQVSLTLGCSHWQCFRRVTLPLARNGLVAGCVMAWARAIGVFGPLMVFVGTSPRVQVMPTAMWLELSIGNIEKSFVIAIVMVAIAGSALAIVHWLVPGRKWS